jgi:chromosome segregation ATPase
MNRTQGILTAGTLTLVMVGAVTVFGRLNPVSAKDGSDKTTPEAAIQEVVQADTQQSDFEAQQAALLAQQTALEQELQVMREREAEYNAEIEDANNTIAELTDAVAAGQSLNQAQMAQAQQTIEGLRNSLAVMQAREAEYTAQIEAANQSIMTLQGYIDNMAAQQAAQPAPQQVIAPAQPAAPSYEDDDHYEDEGHEGEHEGEHEGDDD